MYVYVNVIFLWEQFLKRYGITYEGETMKGKKIKTAWRLFAAALMTAGAVWFGGNAAFAAGVTINETNFPDEAFRKHVAQYDKNHNALTHFYTASAQERDFLVSVGWNYEGVAWKASAGMAKHSCRIG